MTHFGTICPSSTGHLNTMLPLGRELKQRGHRVTVINMEDARSKTTAAELEFQVVGKSDFPPGATQDLFTQLGNLSGPQAFKYTFDWITNTAKMYLQDAPEIVQTEGIEALLVDRLAPEGGTVAEYLNLPFVSICSALMLNREINVPPFSTFWNYDPSLSGLERNRLGYERVNAFGASLRQVINSYRSLWNLPLYNSPNEFHSQLAQIS